MQSEKQLQSFHHPPGSLTTPGLLWHIQESHFQKWPSQKSFWRFQITSNNPIQHICMQLPDGLQHCKSGSLQWHGPRQELPKVTWQPALLGAPFLLGHVHTPEAQGNLGTAGILQHQSVAEIIMGTWTSLQTSSNTTLPARTLVRLQRHTPCETCLAEPPALLTAAGGRPPEEHSTSSAGSKELQPG